MAISKLTYEEEIPEIELTEQEKIEAKQLEERIDAEMERRKKKHIAGRTMQISVGYMRPSKNVEKAVLKEYHKAGWNARFVNSVSFAYIELK